MAAIFQTTFSNSFSSMKIFPALVQIMAWRRPGDKPLSESMMVRLPTHICVTRPPWVNECIRSEMAIPIGIRVVRSYAQNKMLKQRLLAVNCFIGMSPTCVILCVCHSQIAISYLVRRLSFQYCKMVYGFAYQQPVFNCDICICPYNRRDDKNGFHKMKVIHTDFAIHVSCTPYHTKLWCKLHTAAYQYDYRIIVFAQFND